MRYRDVVAGRDMLYPIQSFQMLYMKKMIFAATAFLSMAATAQEPADALRYSWNVPGGTARTQAIGGAMGSLGGDITATYVNPAGLAFYRTSDFVISPIYSFQRTKATYFDRTEKDNTNRFMLGTTGVVLGSSGNGKKVRSAALSIAINRMADFNGDILMRGENNQSSFSQRFVEELQNSGIRDNRIETDFPTGASLLYNTFWIDTVRNGAGQITDFYTHAPVAAGLLQEQKVKTRGGITELALGLAVNIEDKWMFGGSLGVPFLNYRRESEFLEADASGATDNGFNYGLFSEKLSTTGFGLNLKAGAIYKPAEFWRLGLAVHSPTYFSLTDTYEASVETDVDRPDGAVWEDNSKNYTGGNPSEFKYAIITPYKVIGSISYVLREIEDVRKQRGFLTLDVEYVNYKASSFRTSADAEENSETEQYLKSINTAIDQAYKGAFNFRAGGELKFTTIMVRLGAAYYGNPYKKINGDERGSRINLSGGLGYRNKGFFIDLTYVHGINRDAHYAYRLQNSPYQAARINNTAGNILATVGFKF